MKISAKATLICTVFTALSIVTAATGDGEWSEWKPFPANNGYVYHVDSRAREGSRYKSGVSEWYWQYRNRYSKKVYIEVKIYRTDQEGKQITEVVSTSIGPEREYKSGGLWTLSTTPIKSQLLKINFPDTKTRPKPEKPSG